MKRLIDAALALACAACVPGLIDKMDQDVDAALAALKGQ